jgi:hypothetical protein
MAVTPSSTLAVDLEIISEEEEVSGSTTREPVEVSVTVLKEASAEALMVSTTVSALDNSSGVHPTGNSSEARRMDSNSVEDSTADRFSTQRAARTRM